MKAWLPKSARYGLLSQASGRPVWSRPTPCASETQYNMINELDDVILMCDLTEHGLSAGDIGAVVLVHRHAAGHEVEFTSLDGDTIAVVSVYHEHAHHPAPRVAKNEHRRTRGARGIYGQPVSRQRRRGEARGGPDDGLSAPRGGRGPPGGFRKVPGRRSGRPASAWRRIVTFPAAAKWRIALFKANRLLHRNAQSWKQVL